MASLLHQLSQESSQLLADTEHDLVRLETAAFTAGNTAVNTAVTAIPQSVIVRNSSVAPAPAQQLETFSVDFTSVPVPLDTKEDSKEDTKEDSAILTNFEISAAAGPRDYMCYVCGEKAGKHSYYGGQVCASCRAFFRRSVQSKYYEIFQCKFEKRCRITLQTRKTCQFCR